MHPVLLITAKDLWLGLRDRSVLLMAFIIPFTLAVIFSFLFGGSVTEDLEVSFLSLNQDDGELGGHFVDGALGGAAAQPGITVAPAADRPTAVAQVEAGEIDALLVVPAGFTDAVQAGRATAIEVVANVDAAIGRQVAEALARGYAQELTGTQIAVASVAAAAGSDAPPPDEIVDAVRATGLPVTVVDGRVSDNQLDQTTYLAAGMAVFFLFFTVQFGVIGLLEERRNGTLARLYASPFARRSVVAAKTLTSFILGIVSMAVLMVASGVLLGARWGDPLGVAMLVVGGVAAAVSVVLLVAALARTAEQAGNWQSIIAIVLGMAGGVFFDVSRGSVLLERLSLLTPHQWFLRGLGRLAGDGGPSDVLPHTGGLLLFGLVVALLSGVVRRRAGDRSQL